MQRAALLRRTRTYDATTNVTLWARRSSASLRAAQRPGHGAWQGGSLSLSGLLVLPVRHQIIHDRGIGQGRGIAEAARFVLGDLAQDAAHDLAGTGFWQAWGELDLVGRGDRADVLAHPGDQFLAQRVGRLNSGHERHISVDALPLDVV